MTNLDDLHIALEDLTKAVKGQIDLFCRTFNTDFRFESATNNVKGEDQDYTLLLYLLKVPFEICYITLFET